MWPEDKPAYLFFLGPSPPAAASSSSKRSPILVELASGSSLIYADNLKLISSSIGQSYESSESEILSSDSSSLLIYCL